MLDLGMAERRESLERLLREALGDDAPVVLDPDQRFDELGLDSLDVSEFFLECREPVRREVRPRRLLPAGLAGRRRRVPRLAHRRRLNRWRRRPASAVPFAPPRHVALARAPDRGPRVGQTGASWAVKCRSTFACFTMR